MFTSLIQMCMCNVVLCSTAVAKPQRSGLFLNEISNSEYVYQMSVTTKVNTWSCLLDQKYFCSTKNLTFRHGDLCTLKQQETPIKAGKKCIKNWSTGRKGNVWKTEVGK